MYTVFRYHLIFTVRLSLEAGGQFIAEGVTDALDNVTSQIGMMEGGNLFEFTAFVRFGELIKWLFVKLCILCRIAMATTFTKQVILLTMRAMWYIKHVSAWFVTHILVNLHVYPLGFILSGI